ncbi:MAG: antibiotic biosynthesis monooxygenase, partial [Candidatus Competibacteraceae bacterium]|nr:antibiotic biosynthesis monooxygenase [Candidatus Competibacteraceae bacterium]
MFEQAVITPNEGIMIHVLATIQLKPGQRAAFLQEFHQVMPKVHQEQGCIEYG